MVTAGEWPFFALLLPDLLVDNAIAVLVVPVTVVTTARQSILVLTHSSVSYIVTPRDIPCKVFARICPGAEERCMVAVWAVFSMFSRSKYTRGREVGDASIVNTTAGDRKQCLPRLIFILSIGPPAVKSLVTSRGLRGDVGTSATTVLVPGASM